MHCRKHGYIEKEQIYEKYGKARGTYQRECKICSKERSIKWRAQNLQRQRVKAKEASRKKRAALKEFLEFIPFLLQYARFLETIITMEPGE